MKSIHCIASAIAVTAMLAAMPALAANHEAPSEPIRPTSKCLNMSHSPMVYAVDEKTVVASTGPHYYLIALEHACPDLANATPELGTAHGSRYLCGAVGDKVYGSNGVPCAIKGMSIISQARFQKLEARAMKFDGPPSPGL